MSTLSVRPIHAVVAALVAAIVGVGAFFGVRALSSGGNHPRNNQATRTTSTSPPRPGPTTTEAPSTTSSTAPNFASLAGTWFRHGTIPLTISAAGIGSFGVPDYSACPTCSAADAPTNTIAFQLTMMTGHSATGHVTSVTNTSQPVTAAGTSVKPGDSVEVIPVAGDQLQLRIGGSEISTFCGPHAPQGACGA